MAALFEQSEKVMHIRAVEKRIHLSYMMPQDFLIRGNMEQLLILLNNLIDNAMKASQIEGEVCVSVYAKELGIVVEVEDHGIGMEPEQISHIKEAFYRVDKTRSRAAGGTGLGLSICEMIAQLHHAELIFVSKKGKGTIVKLYFPQALSFSMRQRKRLWRRELDRWRQFLPVIGFRAFWHQHCQRMKQR